MQAKNRPEAYIDAADVLSGLTAAIACEVPFEAPEVIICEYAGESEKDIMDEAAELLTARSLTKAELQKKLTSLIEEAALIGVTKEEFLASVENAIWPQENKGGNV